MAAELANPSAAPNSKHFIRRVIPHPAAHGLRADGHYMPSDLGEDKSLSPRVKEP
jgi:hypothetical protein